MVRGNICQLESAKKQCTKPTIISVVTILSMKSFSFLVLFILASSCLGKNDEKSDLKFFSVPVTEKDFSAYINQKDLPDVPNMNADKVIVNEDYPIEIALYRDGKWFYDLPNLDTGSGTWRFDGGKIKLFAERSLFNMNIDIVAVKEQAKDVIIKFSDRFGPKTLPMDKKNIDF